MRDKITVTTAAKFAREAGARQRLWDVDLSGFYLRATGTGGGAWMAKYRAPDGRSREMTLGKYPAMVPREARESARDVINSASKGIDPLACKQAQQAEQRRQRQRTIRAYLDGSYGDYLAGRKSGHDTRLMLERHFSDWLDRPMTTLRHDEVTAWVRGGIGQGRAWATITRAWDALRALLNSAVDDELLDANPLTGFKISRHKPALTEDEHAGETRRALEAWEVDAFFIGLDAYQEEKRAERRNSRAHGKRYLADLDAVEYVDHVKPWLLLAFYTGFRPGDLFGLRWEHIGLPFGRSITKVVEKTAPQLPEPRSFPLSDPALGALVAWHRQQGKPSSGLVFPSVRTGRRMDKGSMQKPWSRVRRLGGLPDDLHLYALRHNFASRLITAGADLLTVSRLMAHTDIQTTIRHYGHLQPDRARDVVNVFAGMKAESARTGNA